MSQGTRRHGSLLFWMTEGSEDRSNRRVGTVIRGKYRVDTFLAQGSMSNVYAATHRNGSRVALKILHPALARDPAMCERFRREGYFANSIGHSGVVRAIDDDVTEDGSAFLVMELLEGETLEMRRRRTGGKLPLPIVLTAADHILDILAAAHAREVVHRDLKPDNVFVTRAGDVKVLDFGVARWNDGKSFSDMTGVGMVLGTPAYMPPEQALGRREDVDAQSDLWAVGATMFAMLSGELVHEGGDAKAKLIATARTPARKLKDVAPDVPRSVAAVVDRALAFDKKERWADATAMREALRWARMSLEGATPFDADLRDPAGDTAPVPTRRSADDAVTVARLPSSEGSVITSAPPITMRQPATSDQAGPKAFRARRARESYDEAPPSTQRLRHAPASEGRDGETDAATDPEATRPTDPSIHVAPTVEVETGTPDPARLTQPLGVPSPILQTAPLVAPPSPSVAPPAISVGRAPGSFETMGRPSHAPGPLLAQIVPRKPKSPLRVVVPILFGAIAGLAGYVAFVRAKADSPRETPVASATPPATSVDAPVAEPPAAALPPPEVSAAAAEPAPSTAQADPIKPPAKSSVKSNDVTSTPERRASRAPRRRPSEPSATAAQNAANPASTAGTASAAPVPVPALPREVSPPAETPEKPPPFPKLPDEE